jgi:Fe-S-cluster containining protein
MLHLTDHQANDFRRAVMTTARSPTFEPALADLDAIYADLALEVDRRRPICTQSGKCCHFDDYGHLLFVTTLELASFLRALSADQPAVATTTGCPYQSANHCSVHLIRPLGCRLFYCDPTSTPWQQQLYEQLHHRISALHDAHAIPYFFVEWRTALAAIGLPTQTAIQTPRQGGSASSNNLISLTVSRRR